MNDLYLIIIDHHSLVKHYIGKLTGGSLTESVECFFNVNNQGGLAISAMPFGEFAIPIGAMKVKLDKDSPYYKTYYASRGIQLVR